MLYTRSQQFCRVDGHFKSARNNRRRLYKTSTPTRYIKRPQKYFCELTTYLASFGVTYLATSLNLAKFSVNERTARLQANKWILIGGPLYSPDCLLAPMGVARSTAVRFISRALACIRFASLRSVSFEANCFRRTDVKCVKKTYTLARV